MRGKNLLELLRAVDLLAKPAGVTIGEMGEELGIDRRSVYRLLALVADLGFPVYDEQIPLDRSKRWRLEQSYLRRLPNLSLPEVRLTPSEILSLYLLKGQAGLFKGTGIERHVQGALAKLGLFVPPKTMDRLEKIQALFLSSAKFAKDYSGKEKIIEELARAMMEGETCRVKYHSFSDNRVESCRIDRLHFFESGGGSTSSSASPPSGRSARWPWRGSGRSPSPRPPLNIPPVSTPKRGWSRPSTW